jgi:hypothetical protein
MDGFFHASILSCAAGSIPEVELQVYVLLLALRPPIEAAFTGLILEERGQIQAHLPRVDSPQPIQEITMEEFLGAKRETEQGRCPELVYLLDGTHLSSLLASCTLPWRRFEVHSH